MDRPKIENRKSKIGAPQARFFWQGVLILIPAVLLAGFGFFSLRQDRVLAEVEAAEHARKLAQELVEADLPEAFLDVPATVEALARFTLRPDRPVEDPAHQAALRSPRALLCLVDENFQLLHPPPVAGWPPPRPLDPNTLDLPQQSDWHQARTAFFLGTDLADGMEAYERFLQSDPPAAFAAIALYETALLHGKIGDPRRAIAYLELLLSSFPDAVGESGFPLSSHAEWQLLKAPDGPRELPVSELARNFCARAVLAPNPLTPLYLEDAIELPRTGRFAFEWKEVWESHERARELHAAWLAAGPGSAPGWFDFEGAPHFAVMVREQDRFWLLARSESAVGEIFRAALARQSVPAYFTVSWKLAGKGWENEVLDGESFKIMAEASGVPGSPLESAAVQVLLSDPGAFYERQRARTLWFGSLIAVSALAVGAGFLTAWRSFRAQQKLSEMKTNFVSSVSHEMRAPLASIRLMAEELNANENNPNSGTYHRLMVQECRRVSGLIENVLDFSRHEQGRKEYEFEPVDLCALLRETVRLMEPYAAERKVPLCLEFDEMEGMEFEPELDSRSMQQLVVNLIDNAIKHSPEGRMVKISLKFPPAGGAQETAANGSAEARNGASERFQIWVEDQGPGIPIEEQGRVFERFYRRGSELRRETPGIGLGLAIVKYVAEAHHGAVRIESGAGIGSRFVVEIPVKR
jgi:signal transduction histidine kinase